MSFTLCTSGAIVTKAGAGVSSTASTSGAILEQYSNEAEAFCNALSRYDWVTNYSTLTDANTKVLLGEACSNIGGIYLISYDMSGYTTRFEAEDMINILWARTDRIINLLRDQKVVDMVS